jgi:hypothetical protein
MAEIEKEEDPKESGQGQGNGLEVNVTNIRPTKNDTNDECRKADRKGKR